MVRALPSLAQSRCRRSLRASASPTRMPSPSRRADVIRRCPTVGARCRSLPLPPETSGPWSKSGRVRRLPPTAMPTPPARRVDTHVQIIAAIRPNGVGSERRGHGPLLSKSMHGLLVQGRRAIQRNPDLQHPPDPLPQAGCLAPGASTGMGSRCAPRVHRGPSRAIATGRRRRVVSQVPRAARCLHLGSFGFSGPKVRCHGPAVS